MSDELDELFKGDAPRPRKGRIVGLLASGLVLALVGLACTSVPGGLLVVLAWLQVDRELARLESGYLSLEHERSLRVLKAAALTGIVVVLALFAVQAFLLFTGFYHGLWMTFIQAVGAYLHD